MRTVVMIGLGLFGIALLNKYMVITAKGANLRKRGITAGGWFASGVTGNELGCDWDEMTVKELQSRGCLKKPVPRTSK